MVNPCKALDEDYSYSQGSCEDCSRQRVSCARRHDNIRSVVEEQAQALKEIDNEVRRVSKDLPDVISSRARKNRIGMR